jgi:D-glycero-D-manno-heptose 1,7-bisphosphate phosphatase
MEKPALFLDRDGVINIDHAYVHRKENFHFIEGIFELVAQANKAEYWVVIVTNQAGIGRGYYTEADFHFLMDWVQEQFLRQGCRIDAVYFCPDHPVHGIGEYCKESTYRKPAPGMLLQAAKDLDINLKQSLMIGDKPSDMEAAQAAGIPHCLYLAPEKKVVQARTITSLHEALLYLQAHTNASCHEKLVRAN